MNQGSIIGLLLGIAILGITAYSGVSNPTLFLGGHALLLVVGGTLVAALLSYPVDRLMHVGKLLRRGILLKKSINHYQLVMDLISAASAQQRGRSTLAGRAASHPFLTEGFQLISEGLLTEEEFVDVLKFRAQYFKKSYMADAKILNALSKYPPAFGLLGASIGMIGMLTNLGSRTNAAIGESMAIALVSTFWGIALANFVLLPLADHMARLAEEDAYARQIMFEGLMMLKRHESPLVVAEKLKGFVPVNSPVCRSIQNWKAEYLKNNELKKAS